MEMSNYEQHASGKMAKIQNLSLIETWWLGHMQLMLFARYWMNGVHGV